MEEIEKQLQTITLTGDLSDPEKIFDRLKTANALMKEAREVGQALDEAAIIIYRRNGEVKVVPIQSAFSVGRDQENALRIDSPYLSGQHFRIEVVDERYILYDCDSKNGTMLNQTRGKDAKAARIAEAVLMSGDVVFAGDVEFLVVLP